MPKADLPTTPKGWFVAMIASFVGFLAGFAITNWLARAFS